MKNEDRLLNTALVLKTMMNYHFSCIAEWDLNLFLMTFSSLCDFPTAPQRIRFIVKDEGLVSIKSTRRMDHLYVKRGKGE